MLYPTFYNKRPCFFAMIAIIFIAPIVIAAESSVEPYTDRSCLDFDFGVQPVGTTQTTKSFYLCAQEAGETSNDQTTAVLLTTNFQPKKAKPKLKMHRWNVPDSRSRVNMNTWKKKANKNRIAVHIESPIVTGKNPTAFQLNENSCNQNTLLPGTTCQLNVSFKPKGAGKQTAHIIIPYSRSGEAKKDYLTIRVAGSGTTPESSLKKVVSMIPILNVND
jgi:hypothetical protein